ncbi:ornithine carbamoyltransferase [Hasllibacter halocynthiae]|uniref:Ornithine carbamoyltransferase n=1 Tax=Hasllibacter halocynthiae TaxID=595589 RepID=A0A2T0X487_9RHOB|nr:ornithine carbamoyltransferase [Hasllibacter halocynthiae]PRY93715.1 ornithine carbamoyltransferase [Hasllibacter halocynthiae]
MPHFLDLHRTDPADLRIMIDRAHAMKAARAVRPKGMPDDDPALAGRMVALIFEKPSTRTRVSFDVGVRQLGGVPITLSGADMQLGHGESVADTARVLSRYVDLIMIRTFREETLEELAETATVPVINGLTDASHPCQLMADVMTFEERRGPVEGRRVAWMGDGNNVCRSFLHAAGAFGFDLTFSGPEALDPDPSVVEWARGRGADVRVERDPARAVADADLVVTDTWVSMGDPESSRQRRHNLLRPYQVNEALLGAAPAEALVMHCLPAHRGEEITDAVLDGPRSVVFDEAENRLHAQKAVMRWCLGV